MPRQLGLCYSCMVRLGFVCFMLNIRYTVDFINIMFRVGILCCFFFHWDKTVKALINF